jgi:hypothetical protein
MFGTQETFSSAQTVAILTRLMIHKSPRDVRIVILRFDSEEMSAEAKLFAPSAVTFIEFQI